MPIYFFQKIKGPRQMFHPALLCIWITCFQQEYCDRLIWSILFHWFRPRLGLELDYQKKDIMICKADWSVLPNIRPCREWGFGVISKLSQFWCRFLADHNSYLMFLFIRSRHHNILYDYIIQYRRKLKKKNLICIR